MINAEDYEQREEAELARMQNRKEIKNRRKAGPNGEEINGTARNPEGWAMAEALFALENRRFPIVSERRDFYKIVTKEHSCPIDETYAHRIGNLPEYAGLNPFEACKAIEKDLKRIIFDEVIPLDVKKRENIRKMVLNEDSNLTLLLGNRIPGGYRIKAAYYGPADIEKYYPGATIEPFTGIPENC